MNDDERLAEVQRWLRYAREDLLVAENMLRHPEELTPRHACFLAQQSAEKSIKAALVFLQIDFPYLHDLDRLRDMLSVDWQVRAAHPDLAALKEWAVEARYPGDWPDAVEADAQEAVRQARAIWSSVCTDFRQRGFDVEE